MAVMNIRFVLRGSLVALIVAVGVIAIWWLSNNPAARPLDPLPSPPTILAARGDLPIGPGGLVEFAQYGEKWFGVGCGFLLQLPDRQVIGVTTAHSVSFNNDLQQIAFGVAGRSGYVRQFDTLLGRPGVARSGDDMTVDYVLLKSNEVNSIDPDLILQPDPRGAPQPGERVAVFSGLGDGNGNRKIFSGTVQTVSDTAVWIVMDDSFDPGGLSGSPFVSEYTGRVVGMTIAVSHRANRVLLGLHPIGSIVRLAQAAAEFPKIKDYRR
jgi:hypothetical protein